MKLLMVVAHERYRDEEFEVPARAFDDAGIDYDVATDKPGTCMGMLGATVEVPMAITDAKAGDYDGVVIVGGVGSQQYLWNHDGLIALVREMNEAGKLVAAICLAPVVLALAGALEGRQATVFETPLSRNTLKQHGATYQKIPVIVDDNVITASGPDAAAAFAEQIIGYFSC